MHMDLSTFRKEYSTKGLHREDLSRDPIEVFEQWFKQASELGIHEPNAMTLATVSPDGLPSQRTVLLKAFNHDGFTFFTNYSSRKGIQIDNNPSVSVLFPWLTLERQIIIQGIVTKVTKEESLEYFRSRPRDSQIGAWVSDQSTVINSRGILEQNLTEISRKYEGKDVPLPPHWGGYRIKPKTIEFWQGAAARIHDRFIYTVQSSGDWLMQRLSP